MSNLKIDFEFTPAGLAMVHKAIIQYKATVPHEVDVQKSLLSELQKALEATDFYTFTNGEIKQP